MKYALKAKRFRLRSLLIAGMCGSSLVLAQPQSWSVAAAPDAIRYQSAGTQLSDGRVLITGQDPSFQALPQSEIFDSSTGVWTVTGRPNRRHDEGSATLLLDGRVLLAGGSFTADAEIYEPASGTWTLTNPMHVDRTDQSATLLPDGRVLIAGGYTFSYVTGNQLSSEIFDPATETWTLTAPMNVWRENHSANLLNDGTVLATGGDTRYGPEGITGTAETYDPASNRWTVTGGMNENRTQHTATLLNDGTVLIAGGFNGFAYLSSSEVYDPTTRTFGLTASMNTARSMHTATLLNDGSVLVAGGKNTSLLRTSEIFDPVNQSWIPAAEMNRVHFRQTAFLLPDGTALIVDRYAPIQPEVFSPTD